MKKEKTLLAMIKVGAYCIGPNTIALIRKGGIWIFNVKGAKDIKAQLAEFRTVEGMYELLTHKRGCQLISFCENGTYVSDNIALEVDEKTKTVYVYEN